MRISLYLPALMSGSYTLFPFSINFYINRASHTRLKASPTHEVESSGNATGAYGLVRLYWLSRAAKAGNPLLPVVVRYFLDEDFVLQSLLAEHAPQFGGLGGAAGQSGRAGADWQADTAVKVPWRSRFSHWTSKLAAMHATPSSGCRGG